MTKDEKIEFIEDIMGNLKQNILDNVDKMPEEWSGRQLRLYIVEKAASIVMPVSFKEKREYQSDVINNDL